MYLPDLVAYHTLCEMNYAKLQRFLSGYDVCDNLMVSWRLLDDSILSCHVDGNYRYTTRLRVIFETAVKADWMPISVFYCHLCHDLNLLEVIALQKTRHLQGKYNYPNSQMLQPDEKWQMNKYFGELLNNCVANAFPVAEQR